MSNCDDVLDDWEDLDEEGLNTALSTLDTSSSTKTETSVDSIASNLSEANHKQTPTKRNNQTAMKILQRSSKQDDTAPTYTRTTTSNAVAFNNSLMNSENVRVTTKKLDVMAINFNPVRMVLHKTEDEYQSANYMAPTANQTVKILRRPTQSAEPRNIDVRPKQPLKSLKQREQEYAEARLRILGSAKNPEDECPSLNAAQANSCVLSTNNSTANAASKTNSPRSQSGPNTYNNLNTYQQHQLQQKQHTSQLPPQTQKPQQQQQQQSPPPASTQLQQYQQNFHSFNPQNYYYTLQQQQQQQSLPTYNNNRTKSMPLLGHTPNNMLTGGGLGKAQYQPQSTMFTKYQQQQQQQQQLQQTIYNHKSLQHQYQQQKPQQSWSPVVGGKVSYTTVRQKQQQQQLQQPEPVLRLPRGPDGSNGFQIRR